MQISKMIKADLEQVTSLAAQLGYPETLEEIAARFAEVDKLSTHQLYVAKSADDKVLGWVHINIETYTLLSDQRAMISALVVDEKHRGLGIGASLITKAEGWAKAKSIPLVKLTSNIKRSGAHRFYEKFGYSIKKSWHLFVKEL